MTQRRLPGGRYYQLTHDYLVHSLRDWLTRKQRETRRGRAELRLAERSASWNAKPENRLLPSVREWANIRLLTKKKDWTEPQRRMMKRAGRVHGLRTLGLRHAGLPDRLGQGSRAMAHFGLRLWWSHSRRQAHQTFPPSSNNSRVTAAGPILGWCMPSKVTMIGNIYMPASPFFPSIPPRLIISSNVSFPPRQANFPCCVIP